MPELPEVENVARGLQYLRGKALRRFEIFDERVWFESQREPRAFLGKTLSEISRRGKYLLLRFDGGAKGAISLVQHLRMTGKMLPEESDALPGHIRAQIGTQGPKAPQVRCRFDFGDHRVVFYDPRRFGTLTAVPSEEEFFATKGIAPDPFTQEVPARAHFLAVVRLSQRPIKAALLDQSLIAGVGNIYADEALHLIRMNPRAPAAKLKDPQKLWDTIRELLAKSIAAGGSSIVDYLGADGQPGTFGKSLMVYGRGGEACRGCGKKISKVQLVGRSTHFCARCQR